MDRSLLIILCLLIANAVFAQKGKDTVVYNLPVVNDKLVYEDSVNVKGRSKASLDSTVKKWFISYFKYYRTDTSSIQDKTIISAIWHQGVLEYHVKPGLINIPYYAVITIHIICTNDYFRYKIYNIYFVPKSGFLRELGFQNDPEYLIRLYKQKHIGFAKSMTIDRGMIRNYLSNMNLAVRKCIASLNKAMVN
jgi:hypothetical protein